MDQGGVVQDTSEQIPEKMSIVWKNVVRLSYIHLSGLYGIYFCLTGQVLFRTFLFQLILGYLALFGVTAGVHRLWSHKSYKANLPLRIILMVCQTLATQDSIYQWARDHRVHHKFTDTNADPHNSNRGFFFSHIGWICVKKHEDVKMKGKSIYLDDLKMDPVVMFQKKYFSWMSLLICILGPWYIPVWLWGENSFISWNLVSMRYIWTLNSILSINSFAHMWGDKPYDRNINPVDTKLGSFISVGESWHNYHHTFPWDYKAAELPAYGFNWTTGFIDFFAWIGWAYELKTVPEKMIHQRAIRTGDGSYQEKLTSSGTKGCDIYYEKDKCNTKDLLPAWGWNDEDMANEDKELAVIFNKTK